MEARAGVGGSHTPGGISIVAQQRPDERSISQAIFERGSVARENEGKFDVRPAQFPREEIAPPAGTPMLQAGPVVEIFGRGGREIQTIQSENVPERGERISVINAGVHIVVRGLDQLGNVSMETDRLVIWTPQGTLTDRSAIDALRSGE